MRKPKLRLKISLTFNVLLFITIAFMLLQTQWFRIIPVQKLSEGTEKELADNAAMALLSEDVPVGALLTYEGKTIGRGYNTVYRDGNISGHAEINAINDAINDIGINEFMGMDRSKFAMISTYEPCEMCKGMLVHYRINDVKFLKDKSLTRWLKSNAAEMSYEFNKRKAGNEHTQDSLFLLHPHFPGAN